MIIKAEIRGASPKKPEFNINKIVKKHIPKEKRYLICANIDDESKIGYVFDLREQRIVYKVNSKKHKNIEDVFNDIYSSFKRSDTTIVDHNVILNAIVEIKEDSKKEKVINESLQLEKEAKEVERTSMQESIHIRKIKETYKYIDKYKVKMDIEIKKIKDGAEIYLYDTLNGIDKGIHILKYDYYQGIYNYFYGNRLIVSSTNLEDIFK